MFSCLTKRFLFPADELPDLRKDYRKYYGGKQMNCETNDIPLMGIMGIVLHKMLNTAKGMYQEFDLNRSQAAILFTLHRRKSISQKELARELNMTAPSITSAIQKMEREKYITRETDKSDQRVMRLTLAERGKACIQSVKNVGERMDEIIQGGMSLEEQLLFRRLILQVKDNLEKYERKEEV